MGDVIKIYADGACRGNQNSENIGAIGIVLLYGDYKKEIKEAYKNTTNNKMEILSVIKGLEAIKNFNIPVEIYSDSQYVVSTINDNWKRNKNLELWDRLDKLLFKFNNYKFIKVKGHADTVLNNRADELANMAMDMYKE